MAEEIKKLNREKGDIRQREIIEEMKESYLDYAMSVIVSRALPDVRDGLKPVQRRILYAMYDMGLRHDAKFRKSATVVGECFVKDTLILTPKGLLPIQEIKIGDLVYTQNGSHRVVRLYEMPKKPLLKVTLENGISNIVTPSQKFKVLTSDWKFEWKEAKCLTKDDYLIIKADYPEIKELVRLSKIEQGQPEYLNPNIAYLLGFFISDGSISNDYSRGRLPRITFSIGGDNKDIAKNIVSIFHLEFDYIPTIETRRYKFRAGNGKILNSKQYTVRINRKAINEFFVSNFSIERRKAPTKRIPLQLFQSPPEVIFAFISGLIDGGGFIHSKRTHIQYSSVSEQLINDLQILLQHQGIFSSKYLQRTGKEHIINGRTTRGNYNPYSLEIRGGDAVKLARHLNLSANQKRGLVQRILQGEVEGNRRDCGGQNELIPYAGKMLFRELHQRHLGGGWYQGVTGEKFRMGIKHRAGCKIRHSFDLWEKPLRKTQVIDWGIKNKLEKIGSPFFDFLDHIIKNKIYFLKVSSIKKFGSEKTYDFEVESNHEFIANGVVSHNCLGKYHPHGDAPVYGALARMAQDFSLRYPLVEPQGNFGSIDGDPPAAQRYTECKLSKIGQELLKDIEKETVGFMPNFDGTKKEPIVLPSPLPQLLLNGSLGIAVGMATNIPPHNLSEVCDALIFLLSRPQATIKDIFQFIKGPDFPGGGIIYGQEAILTAYSQGRGSILTRGKAEIFEKRGNFRIIVSEIPFGVQKSAFIKQIAKLIQVKKLKGVRDVRDESDREGMRIVMELKSTSQPQRILNSLYQWTSLQSSFHYNMIALVEGIQPKLLNLLEILEQFLGHRQKVARARTKFDLERAKERVHILKGLCQAIQKIDLVIKTIRASENALEAQKNLMRKFKLTQIQARAILEMRLSALAKLERAKIEKDLKDTARLMKELSATLKSPKKIRGIIEQELQEYKKIFGDERKTKIVPQKIGAVSPEDLIARESAVITLTKAGFIKRLKPSTYRLQHRGGKGILGARTVEGDIVSHLIFANTHDDLFFFTDSGKIFQTKTYEVPEAERTARGKNLLNFLDISSEEKVLDLIPLTREETKKYLVMVTKNGIIKKTGIDRFKNVRRTGLIAIKLKKGDLLRRVQKSRGSDEIVLITQKGMSLRFRETDVRFMGRTATGVKGMRLKKGDEIIGMEVVRTKEQKNKKTKEQKKYLLVVTENGYGKRTELSEYRGQKRGGLGIKTIKITKKTGELVAAKILNGLEKHLIAISQKGQVVKIPINSISKIGRATQGVRIMRLKEGDKVASTACL